MINRFRQRDINSKTKFINMLKGKNIEWETFTTNRTFGHPNDATVYDSFNVSVDRKYETQVNKIHYDVYGFKIETNAAKI